MKISIKALSSYSVLTTVVFLIYVYPINILQYLITGQVQSYYLSLFETLVSVSIITFYFRTSTTLPLLKLFSHEGLALGFISFWVLNIALITEKFSQLESKIIGYISITLICLLFVFSYISTLFIVTKKLSFQSNKVSRDYCLALISDIHLGSNGQKHLQRLVNKINKINAETVLICGDLIDSSSFDLSKLILLQSIQVPKYFVTGNHEHYLKNFNETIDSLKKHQLITINNTSILFEELNIIGISDNLSFKEKQQYVKRLTCNDRFNICLVHQPSIWEQIRDDVDLMFSGHTHRGQIFPFNFFVRLRFKYIYGHYKHKSSNLIVSSGAGTWGPKVRLGSFNEIIELNIQAIK